MPLIPNCGLALRVRQHRCSLYAHNPHLVCYKVCGVHPSGIATEACIDFRPDPNFKEEEQLEILDTHPFLFSVVSA